jgi:HSP20 family protein
MHKSNMDHSLKQDVSLSGLKAIGWHMGIHSYEWSPPTDVYETDASFVIRLEIAGMQDDDFSILYENNYMIIRGTRGENSERRAYHQMEIRYGEFSSAIEMPLNADFQNADAHYQNGFLTIVIPKIKPSTIKISGQ